MLYVEETKYFRKLLNAPGNICIPSAFGIQIGCVSLSCLDTFKTTGFRSAMNSVMTMCLCFDIMSMLKTQHRQVPGLEL